MARNATRRQGELFYSRWFLLAMTAAVLLLAFAWGRAYYQEYQLRIQIENLRDEANRLEAKKIAALEIIQYINSPEFAESKARTELNLIKSGEKMAIILDGQNNALQTSDEVVRFDTTSNARKWWLFFKERLMANED